MIPVDPFYRLIWEDGDTFDYGGDSESMVAQIRERDPEDAEGYLKFVDYARKVFIAGYCELAATPFLNFSDMVRVAPALVRLRADRSVYSTVSRFVKNDHIRQALSFHSLLVGGNPFETSSIYTLIHYLEREWGVFFPRGGTGALVRALVKLFEELGGRDPPLLAGGADRPGAGQRPGATPRDQRGGRARSPFDLVVSNADVHHTYGTLSAASPRAEADAQTARAHEVVDVPLRALLRHRPPLRRTRRAPHDPLRASLRGAAQGHLPRAACPRTSASTCTRRGDRPLAGPRGLRDLLRAVAGPAPGQRTHRLERRRRGLRRPDPGRPGDAPARPAQARGDASSGSRRRSSRTSPTPTWARRFPAPRC